MYIKLNHAFSYNLPIIIIIGARGTGKTYSVKKFVLKKYFNNNERFIWLRDTENAIKQLKRDNAKTFFQDILDNNEFNDFKPTMNGETINIDKKFCGYLFPISTYYNRKGNVYTDITNIVFDEFIPEGNQYQVDGRTWSFINTISSIARTRKNFRVILLANALDRGNELLQLFNFNITGYGTYVNKDKGAVLVYAPNTVEFDETNTKSIVGKILSGTQYEENIMYNKFREDINIYYDKRPSKSRLIAILQGKENSCRIYMYDNMLYCGKNNCSSVTKRLNFVSTIKNVNTTNMLIPPQLLKAIKKSFACGNVRFDTAFTKKTFMEFIKE